MARKDEPSQLRHTGCITLKHLVLGALLLAVQCPLLCSAQAPTGNIEGIVTDASGAVIRHANITVTQKARGRVFTTTADADGHYAVSALEPADYVVQVEAPRFKTGLLKVRVDVGKVATGNITLQVGELRETVQVVANEETQIDASRNTVSGVVTARQLEDLPANGRNFLDLAGLEPGVQVVDASTLEMTKTGFTAVSIAGGEGRTTRIQVDGIDITDEVVGTTMQNYSLDALQGFQISQFTLDPSTSLSNTGAVNIVTRSGSNELHGSGFVYWRDHHFAARVGPSDAPFHRVQGGFRLGGPVVKDRVFWFLNFEQTGQHNSTVLAPPPPFEKFSGIVTTPYLERLGTGRLDWNPGSRTHVFARFSHNDNNGATGFGGVVLSPVINKNNTNSTVAGADVTLSHITHSLRYGHTNFADYLDPAMPAGVPNIPVEIAFDDTGAKFGPNLLARQHSLQTNDQFRYDGTSVFRGHVLQYGINYSHISANLFGAVFSVAPLVDTFTTLLAGSDPSDPLNYIPIAVTFGNGLGFLSDKPSHGFKFGGITNDRVAWYVADSWKALRDLTLNFGLRWEIDPGQVNRDIVRPAILDTVLPGQSGRMRLDKDNFSPTFGFAWNVLGRDATVIRGGAGIYYETNIFENVLFDRDGLLPITIAPQFPSLFGAPGFNLLTGPNGDVIFDFNTISMQPLGVSVNQILAAQAQFQAESLAATSNFPNGPIALLPPGRLPGTQNTLGAILAREFTQPYSIHTNIGLQRRLGKNWLMQADFVRNRGVHAFLVRDYNRVGAADTLNVPRVQQAVAATLAQFGASSIDDAIAKGAAIGDFANNGLGRGFAFPGNNPNFGELAMVGTQGLSTYKGLLVKVTGRAENFARVFHSASWGISYALSRFEATQADQANALKSRAFNNDCPTCFFGPVGGDRTHQLAINSLFSLPWGFQWNSVTHFGTAVPVTLRLNQVAGDPSEIFFTDMNGDGQVSDVLPGTNLGAFGRSIKGVRELNAAITNFNQTFAGQFTPASQALVKANLFTAAQLRALGAVIPSVQLAPPDQVATDWFWTTDFRISKVFDTKERVQIEPAVDVFNVFNKANFDPIDNPLSGILSGLAGSVNGTPPRFRANRFGLGTGSFSPGIPRAVQFSLRLRF